MTTVSRIAARAAAVVLFGLGGLSRAEADYVGLIGSVTGIDDANLSDGSYISPSVSRPATVYFASSPDVQFNYVDFVSEFRVGSKLGESTDIYNDFSLNGLFYDQYNISQSGRKVSIDVSSPGGSYIADVYHDSDSVSNHYRIQTTISPFSFQFDLDSFKLMRSYNDTLLYDLSQPYTLELTYNTSSATSTFDLTVTQLRIYSSNVMAVPVPHSAPMFGAAVLIVGAAGCRPRRKRASTAGRSKQTP